MRWSGPTAAGNPPSSRCSPASTRLTLAAKRGCTASRSSWARPRPPRRPHPFVHQDLGIVGELDAVDNVALGLGYARTRLGAIGWRTQRRRTAELLDRFGVAVPLWRPLKEATPVERTAVAVVRALAGSRPGEGLLVLDEPTAALPYREVEALYRLVRAIHDTGTAVLLISHRLDEVMAIADYVTVMRGGTAVGGGATTETDVATMASMIAGGQEIEAAPTQHRTLTKDARIVLSVEGLSAGTCETSTFSCARVRSSASRAPWFGPRRVRVRGGGRRGPSSRAPGRSPGSASPISRSIRRGHAVLRLSRQSAQLRVLSADFTSARICLARIGKAASRPACGWAQRADFRAPLAH